MLTSRRLLSLILLCIAIGGAWSAAASAAPAIPQEVSPEAKKVIDSFGAYFTKVKGFKVTFDVALAVEQPNKPVQNLKFLQHFSAERPNKLMWTAESPQGGGATIVSDGEEVSLVVGGLQKYATEKAPPTWQALLENPIIFGSMSSGNAVPLTSALLSDEPAKKLIEKSETVEYGGRVTLGDTECHLIKSSGGELDWQLWIDAGDKPLPVQFVPDLEKAFARMARQTKGKSPFENLKATNIVTLKGWEIDPKLAEDVFAFNAPEGAKKVGNFMEIFGGGREQTEPEPSSLLGKAAPEVKLDLLDGGSLNLASLKGKKVVVLDFWATWCGPCRRAMPVIEQVVSKFKDKGVELYTVNIQEAPDDIQKFLEESELKVAVALDKDGAVAKSYEANAIPQTVLIGKDGTVQVVKVGLSVDLEGQLTKEIESLLAGKNLAAETIAAYKKKQEGGGEGDDAKEGKAAPKAKAGKK